MLKSGFLVSRSSLSEWKEVIKWEMDEQWDIGIDDEECFFQVDPNGFFMGYRDGVPVASVSIVNFDETYSHVGHFLVAPHARAQGYGLNTWKQAITHDVAYRSGLDSVVEQRANYEKWGYSAHYRIFRMSGFMNDGLVVKEINSSPIDEYNLSEVIDFDEYCCGYNRGSLLRSWFTAAGRRGWIYREGNEIAGVLGARLSTAGIRIGPIYARNHFIAQQMLQSIRTYFPSSIRFTVDVPEFSSEMIQDFIDLGFVEQFHTYRMYRGGAPAERSELIKAIASLDLG